MEQAECCSEKDSSLTGMSREKGGTDRREAKSKCPPRNEKQRSALEKTGQKEAKRPITTRSDTGIHPKIDRLCHFSMAKADETQKQFSSDGFLDTLKVHFE